jgi:hypothetical protein
VCLLYSYVGGYEICCKFCSGMAWKTVCWKVKYVRNNAEASLNEVACDCMEWIMFNGCVPMRVTENTYCIFVRYCHMEVENCDKIV